MEDEKKTTEESQDLNVRDLTPETDPQGGGRRGPGGARGPRGPGNAPETLQ